MSTPSSLQNTKSNGWANTGDWYNETIKRSHCYRLNPNNHNITISKVVQDRIALESKPPTPTVVPPTNNENKPIDTLIDRHEELYPEYKHAEISRILKETTPNLESTIKEDDMPNLEQEASKRLLFRPNQTELKLQEKNIDGIDDSKEKSASQPTKVKKCRNAFFLALEKKEKELAYKNALMNDRMRNKNENSGCLFKPEDFPSI